MNKLTRRQRGALAGVSAVVIWLAVRLVLSGSVEVPDVVIGLVFAAFMGGLVFWLAGYKDPEVVRHERG